MGLITGDSFSRIPYELSSEVDSDGQTKEESRNHPGTKGEMVFFFLPPVPFSLLESVRTQGKHLISGEHGRLKAKTLMTKNLSGESSEKSIA